MEIRTATLLEFNQLWDYTETKPTYNHFLNALETSNAELWIVDNCGELIAELYIFWNSIDKDEANGIFRAYLCAFKVKPHYQGKGIGTKLINHAFLHIKARSFSEVTIGIDNDDYDKLSNLYKKYGFEHYIKHKSQDDHNLDELGTPIIEKEPYELLMKKL